MHVQARDLDLLIIGFSVEWEYESLVIVVMLTERLALLDVALSQGLPNRPKLRHPSWLDQYQTFVIDNLVRVSIQQHCLSLIVNLSIRRSVCYCKFQCDLTVLFEKKIAGLIINLVQVNVELKVCHLFYSDFTFRTTG